MVTAAFNGSGDGQQQLVGKAVGAKREGRRCNNQIKVTAAAGAGSDSGHWQLTAVMDHGVQRWW